MSEPRHRPGCQADPASRIGVEIAGLYDGVLFWECPDCGVRWHRWSQGKLHERARPYVLQEQNDVEP